MEKASQYGMTVVPYAGFDLGDISQSERVDIAEKHLRNLSSVNSSPLRQLLELFNKQCEDCRNLLASMNLLPSKGRPCAILLAHFYVTSDLPEHVKAEHREILRIASTLYDAAILLQSVKRSDITAIIAPNDMVGRSYLSVLDLLGCRVPEDISVLGFDNWFRFSFFPLSTVDFGLASLGYRALHTILGDIPDLDREHEIAATPYVEDRGSVRVHSIR